MPRVQAPACPHPHCGARMVRACVRDAGRFRPVGWYCPECAGFIASCPR
ncbi:MAG: hypothetical protein WC382_09460 [Methanoregulaceae archaeon]